MSYELIAIIASATIQIVIAVVGFTNAIRRSDREFREIARIQKAIAGLVVQESEKVQQLLRA